MSVEVNERSALVPQSLPHSIADEEGRVEYGDLRVGSRKPFTVNVDHDCVISTVWDRLVCRLRHGGDSSQISDPRSQTPDARHWMADARFEDLEEEACDLVAESSGCGDEAGYQRILIVPGRLRPILEHCPAPGSGE